MSTILKALKRLEHEKQAEAVRAATHDPLAPALDAPEPKPAARRAWAGPLVVAAAAAIIGAGLSYGLASWWFSQGGQGDAATNVAAGTPSTHPLAAIPSTPSGTTAGQNAAPATSPPVGGIETVAQAPVVAPTRRAVGRSNVVVQAATPDPDPWEAAARAAPSEEESEADVAGQSADDSSKAKTASSTASKAASSPGATASSNAPRSTVAPSPSAGASSSTAAPKPTRRTAHAQSIEGSRAVSSLPEVTLPEPAAPSPPPPVVEVAKKSTPAPVSRTEPASTATAKPKPSDASVKIEAPDSRLEIFVVKTVWHPRPDRRSAQLRLSDRTEAVEVREEDVVEGYFVREITPSSVVLVRGDVEVTHRVGR